MGYKHDYDKAMTRLVGILNKLYIGESVTIMDLAVEFGCSEKTIQRDIYQRLSSFPIEKIGKEFRFTQGQSIEKSMDINDALTLDILERMSEGVGADFAMRARKLL
jgi:DeoR/GlpR family transcriptional regulator of sugar metabolism